jgi:hypothetical protein
MTRPLHSATPPVALQAKQEAAKRKKLHALGQGEGSNVFLLPASIHICPCWTTSIITKHHRICGGVLVHHNIFYK